MTPPVQMRSESGIARLTQNKRNWNQIKPVLVRSGHQDDDCCNVAHAPGKAIPQAAREAAPSPTAPDFACSVIHYQTCTRNQALSFAAGLRSRDQVPQLLEQEVEGEKEKGLCG